jgi:hypothetical protein
MGEHERTDRQELESLRRSMARVAQALEIETNQLPVLHDDADVLGWARERERGWNRLAAACFGKAEGLVADNKSLRTPLGPDETGQQEYSITAYYRDNNQPYDETATAKTPEAAAALCAWQCGQDNGYAQLTIVTVRDARGEVCNIGTETQDFTFGSDDPCPVNDAGELIQ